MVKRSTSGPSWNQLCLHLAQRTVRPSTPIALSGTTLYAGGQFRTLAGQSRDYLGAVSTATGEASSSRFSRSAARTAASTSGCKPLPKNSFGTPIFIPAPDTVPRESYQPNDSEFPAYLHVTALAERHYGDLQGLNKDEVLAQYGEEQFVKWRRGYDTPPPNGESLKDTVARALPYFYAQIRPRLARGQTVLISAHGNSLRALTKELEGISDQDIIKLEIPTGVPIVYRLDVDGERLRIVDKQVLGPA